ncbi:MAG: lysylphosphatidylglycerol synthase transmembrane domain-containing protein [Chloroflexota bacterium]
MKDWKRWLPGAVISIGLIAAILSIVDLSAMVDAIKHANYGRLGIAFTIGFIWMGIRAMVWWTLLQNRGTYKDVFWSLSAGYLLNNVLPFRLGELGRAFLLSRKTNMKFLEILPTIVIERVVDLGFSAAILLAALPFVTKVDGSDRVAYIVGGAVIVGLAVMYILARNNKWALDLFHKLSARWPTLQRVGGSFLEPLFAGLGILTDGWLFLRFLFWMSLNWGIAIVSYYFIVSSFFPEANAVWAMFGLGMAAFGGAIPSLPGGVGTFEGVVTYAMTVLSGDESKSFAVALTARFYNYLNSGVLGIIALTLQGETLSGVYKELLNLRNKENQ